jgi:hypothetical protein
MAEVLSSMESENQRIVKRRVKIRTRKKRGVKKSFFNKKLVFGKKTSLYYWEVSIMAAIILILFICLLFVLINTSYDSPTDLKDYRG